MSGRLLGYDKSAQPVQVFPRPVTKFSNTVIDISMTVRDSLLNFYNV